VLHLNYIFALSAVHITGRFAFNSTAVILIIAVLTFVSTLLGGLFALKFNNKLYLILGFSAGAVIGVAFFDLLPAALELSAKTYNVNTIVSFAGLGFLFYLIIDRFILHAKQKTDNQTGTLRGKVIAFCLTVHSFLDGVTIGLGFQVSPAIGSFVAAAVLVHDFSDGINTINVILKENGQRKYAIKWLIANAAAPILGAYSTFYYSLPKEKLGLLLSVVAGFFIYIGAVDFFPESQRKHPGVVTSLMTLLGIVIIYTAVRLSGG
jgi:ZIP family zinc transporter